MNRDEILRIVANIPGTAGRMDYADNLYKLCHELPENSTIIEIGTQNGGSAAVFGLTLKEKNVKIYCVDPCFVKEDERPESYKAYKEIGGYTLDGTLETFKNLGLDKYITCLPGTSEEILSKWQGEKFDMLFIDGNHTYDAVMIDMLWLKYAKDKCMLILDDWIVEVQDACLKQLPKFPGFSQRADHNFWPMYFLRGY